jgi:hypothetical protein
MRHYLLQQTTTHQKSETADQHGKQTGQARHREQ